MTEEKVYIDQPKVEIRGNHILALVPNFEYPSAPLGFVFLELEPTESNVEAIKVAIHLGEIARARAVAHISKGDEDATVQEFEHLYNSEEAF